MRPAFAALKQKVVSFANDGEGPDEPDVATATTMCTNEAQWRAGVNRQARPDAHEHQVAAALALGKKRKAKAMSEEERAARRNEGKRAKRAEAKQREEAEARAAAQRMQEVSQVVYELIEDVVQDWMLETHPRLDELNEWLGEDGDVSETEFDDFIEWLQRERIEPGELEEDDYEPDCFVELFDDWRNSDDYQHKQVDYEMEDWDYDANGEDCREDDPVTSEEEESEDPSELYKYSCRDDGGEPDDPYDSDYGPDLDYEGLHEMGNNIERKFGPPCHVRASLKPRRGKVKLTLSIVTGQPRWANGKAMDWDDYADSVYADMEAATRPLTTINELPAPPRRCDYDLGEEGRQAYHNARSAWYSKRTGKPLTGDIAEQEELFDNACRYLRARSGRSRM